MRNGEEITVGWDEMRNDIGKHGAVRGEDEMGMMGMNDGGGLGGGENNMRNDERAWWDGMS